MYTIIDPDEYETTTKLERCPQHKLNPNWQPMYPFKPCNCRITTTQRRRSPTEILALRAERRRRDEDAILARADQIRAARARAGT